jgi:branched-chain amino acid aminotransferase
MEAKDRYFFINKQILPAAEAALQLNDLGLFRGYSIFDYFRTHKGEPFLMQAYLQRFRSSAAQLRLTVPLNDESLEAVILELIQLNGFPESGVRLLLTGGYSENVFSPSDPNLIIRIEKSVLPDASFYTRGVKLLSAEYMRDLPTVKTTNYLNAIRLWPAVEAAGATELLYHWGGYWLECSRSNFFIVANGVLITPPPSAVLPGVTRAQVFALARQAGIPVREQALPLAVIAEAEEAFITGTTKKIMPVVQIDEQQIGTGKPGPLTLQLMQAWKQLEEKQPQQLVL